MFGIDGFNVIAHELLTCMDFFVAMYKRASINPPGPSQT
jgi:hypothetical protein